MNHPVWVISIDEECAENEAQAQDSSQCIRSFCSSKIKERIESNRTSIQTLTLAPTGYCGNTLENDMPYWICTKESDAQTLKTLLGVGYVVVSKYDNLFSACCSDWELLHEHDGYLNSDEKEQAFAGFEEESDC